MHLKVTNHIFELTDKEAVEVFGQLMEYFEYKELNFSRPEIGEGFNVEIEEEYVRPIFQLSDE